MSEIGVAPIMSDDSTATTLPASTLTVSANVAGPFGDSAVTTQSPRNALACSGVTAAAADGDAAGAAAAGAAAGVWAACRADAGTAPSDKASAATGTAIRS